MEDVNNILNSGDVTGIYQEKDTEDINTACKRKYINIINLYSIFLLTDILFCKR